MLDGWGDKKLVDVRQSCECPMKSVRYKDIVMKGSDT